MKIYTKTGDDGSTGLYGGARCSKNSVRIRAIGEVDELNACLGVAACSIEEPNCLQGVREIQNRLFDLGAELANPRGESRARVSAEDVAFLEDSIDAMTFQLPQLRAFILPGGSPAAAWLHLARTVCRRCERSLIELNEIESVVPQSRIYINRLSDWLFTAARLCNSFDNSPEIEWHPREKPHD